jgi:hypothetical protein
MSPENKVVFHLLKKLTFRRIFVSKTRENRFIWGGIHLQLENVNSLKHVTLFKLVYSSLAVLELGKHRAGRKKFCIYDEH